MPWDFSNSGAPSLIPDRWGRALRPWVYVQGICYRHPDSPSRKLRNKIRHFLFPENLKDPLVRLFLVWPWQVPEVVGCWEATSWGTGLMTHRGYTLRAVHSPGFFAKTLSGQFLPSLSWPRPGFPSPPQRRSHRCCPPCPQAGRRCHWCQTSRFLHWFESGPPKPAPWWLGPEDSSPSGGPWGCRDGCSSCGNGRTCGAAPGCVGACGVSGARTGWTWRGTPCIGKVSLRSGVAGGSWDCWCCWTACGKPTVWGEGKTRRLRVASGRGKLTDDA